MEGLKIIDERTVQGKDFRIYGDVENPLFLAKDVAKVVNCEWFSRMRIQWRHRFGGHICLNIIPMFRNIMFL